MMCVCAVPGPPKSLSLAAIGATHFMMEWLPPDEPNGEIIGYHFSYQSSKTKHFFCTIRLQCIQVWLFWIFFPHAVLFILAELKYVCVCCVYVVISLNLGRLQYRAITDDPEVSVERVTGLNPNTTYRVYLRAATGQGTGEPIFVDATTQISGGNACLYEVIMST